MTHDELLIEVNRRLQVALYNGDIPALYALRAVVELHKPHDKYEGVCGGCWEEESGFSDYPCPTIQAIEKEING